jgi:glycine dehydrogenase subunit 1
MHRYFPQTSGDIAQMLDKIGKKDLDDLFSQIDPKLTKARDFRLPEALSEDELKKEMARLGSRNKQLVSFLGAGSYDTFQFSVCHAITSREEFYTAYTPYQPEISQGTLQYIFEYQSMICELTGMDIANASMYDGATATAEAMFMAATHTKRNKVLVSSTLNPKVIDVVKTYAKYRELQVELIEERNGITSLDDLQTKLSEEVGAVIVAEPNFYGIIEDYHDIQKTASDKGALLVMNADPSTLPVLKTPRAWGADIACGEAQSLGIPLSFGGPYLGYLACTNKLMRKLPGRISGMTKDVDGKRGFVLTLQAREQHIRREKATSNICSNQSLMALNAAVYMSLLGKTGLKEVAMRAYNNAHYLKDQLLATGKFMEGYDQPFFKEFVLKYSGDASMLNDYLLKHQYLGGLILKDNEILFCAPETRTKAEMDELVRLAGEAHVR